MPTFDSGSVAIGYPISSDYRIAALQGDFLNGSHQIWLPLDLTYSFPSGSTYFDGGLSYGQGEVSAGWFPLNGAQQEAVRKALKAWSDVSGITFTEVADDTTVGDLRFAFTWDITGTVAGWAYTPASGNATAGDVWLNASLASETFGPSSGSYGTYNPESAENYHTLLHEIGHALGLSHSFVKPGETRGTAPLPTEEDHLNNTVMSYSPYPHHGGPPSTPMPYDILAIQYLYIPNFYHKAGNDTYSFDINDINLLTIWDASGVDTIVATNNANITKGNGTGLFSVIDLREGAGSQIGFLSTEWADPYYNQSPNGFGWRSAWPNIYIAYGAVVENAVGSNGKDMITGNAVNNKITGGGGDDVIDGGAGVDTAAFSGNRGQYMLSKTANGYLLQDTVPNRDGTDSLISIERLQFTVNRVALDLAPTDSAGQAVLFIGVLAPNLVASPATVGLILNYMDGGLSMQQLNQLVVDSGLVHTLAGGNSNANVARLAFENVGGVPATPDMIDLLVSYMDGRVASFTQSEFLTVVANLEANHANVNLVGLAQAGIEYAVG